MNMDKQELAVGIDIGSTSSEIVVIDRNRIVICRKKLATGHIMNTVSQSLLDLCRREDGLYFGPSTYIGATGYGRKLINIEGLRKVEKTEIICFAKGAGLIDPEVRTVIDIGGQDSKVIALEQNGKVSNFTMNDKCAAGTGRFFELIANHFHLDLSKLGELALQSTKEIKITNMCAVFAESEIISLVANGVSLEDIIRAVAKSICQRVIGMAERIGIRDKILFCGGVARNAGVIEALRQLTGKAIHVPENVEFVGALGAALFAHEELLRDEC